MFIFFNYYFYFIFLARKRPVIDHDPPLTVTETAVIDDHQPPVTDPPVLDHDNHQLPVTDPPVIDHDPLPLPTLPRGKRGRKRVIQGIRHFFLKKT